MIVHKTGQGLDAAGWQPEAAVDVQSTVHADKQFSMPSWNALRRLEQTGGGGDFWQRRPAWYAQGQPGNADGDQAT